MEKGSGRGEAAADKRAKWPGGSRSAIPASSRAGAHAGRPADRAVAAAAARSWRGAHAGRRAATRAVKAARQAASRHTHLHSS